MPIFESLPLLVWPGELPKLRDSYTDFSSFVTQTSFVTQDDLVYTSYHFYCIPETKLILNHVSFVKKYELTKLTFGDLTLTPALQVEPKVCQIHFSEHYSWILHAKWPQNMYHMATLGYKNMVTFGDLILTWPSHVTSPMVSKDLDMFNRGPSMKSEAHSLLCLVFVARRIQKPRFWPFTSVWPDLWPET